MLLGCCLNLGRGLMMLLGGLLLDLRRGWLLWWLDHDLIVLISMLVTYFFLIVGTTPLTIDDILILIGAWREGFMCQSVLKNVATRVHTFHFHPLLPITERSDNKNFVAALTPGENMLGWRWWRWHHWLRSYDLLLGNSCHLLLLLSLIDHLLWLWMEHILLICGLVRVLML